MRSRILAVATALAAATLSSQAAIAATPNAVSGAAGTAVQIAGVDISAYPRVTVSVVTKTPTRQPPRLTENGVPAEGVNAVNLGATKSVVLAIDTSQSMAGASLANATVAAQAFVDSKPAGDRIAVLTFGRQATQLTNFSASTGDADAVLHGLAVDRRPGTALYDAVSAAASALRATTTPGRVIVLLTDGRDVSSSATLDQAVAAARKAGASIYSIGIESRSFDPSVLEAIAHDTNGTYHGAADAAALRQEYASIADELDRTWRLGYETTARPGDQLELRANVPGAGYAQASLSVPLSFATAPPSAPTTLLPKAVYTTLGTIVLALIVGALIVSAALMLVILRRGSWVKRRLAPHVDDTRLRRLRRRERLSFLAALFSATEAAFGQRAQWRTIEKLLVRANVPLRPAEFVWASAGCGLGLGLLFAIFGSSAPLILVAMASGGAIPYAIVSLRIRRRTKAFENQLADMLTTIAASLKAGHSFKHGLQAVVDESQPPTHDELHRVLTEAGLGRSMDDALAEMAERLGSEDFAFAITAVTIQRQVGGSLAALFEMVSETVRQRQQFARKIRSLTAMGRMSAYTLVAIPFFIAIMISLVNPVYMSPLFHSHLGHILVALALSMMAIGSLLLRKIVSFKG